MNIEIEMTMIWMYLRKKCGCEIYDDEFINYTIIQNR